MRLAYNIVIFFTIILMATTLKPKTLQEVLAEQTQVVTPSTTPASTSPTLAINQAKAAENKAAAAERAAAKQTGSLSASIPVPTTPEVDLG